MMIISRYMELLSSLQSARAGIPLFLTSEERAAVEQTISSIEYYTRLQITEIANDNS
jgi:hypothetical protein